MNKLVFIFLMIFGGVLLTPAQSGSNKSDSWTGFYVGANVFGSNDQSDVSARLLVNQISNITVTGRGLVVVPGTTVNFAASQRKFKWAGGGQAGYQWQIGRVVFGSEADFSPSARTLSLSQTFSLPPTAIQPATTETARRDIRVSSETSLLGRGGVTFGKTLIYGTGGYATAQVRVSSRDTFTNPGGLAATGVCGQNNTPCQFNSGPEGPVITTATDRNQMNGWTLGGGIAHKFGKHLSIGFEYRHTDLRKKVFNLSGQTTFNTGPETHGDPVFADGFGIIGLLGSVSTGPTTVSLKGDSFGVKVNFHF